LDCFDKNNIYLGTINGGIYKLVLHPETSKVLHFKTVHGTGE